MNITCATKVRNKMCVIFFFISAMGTRGKIFCDFPFTYLDHELLAKTLQVTNTERGKC